MPTNVYFIVDMTYNTSPLEGWPSGQWQQTVNLPTKVYVSSNLTPSTIENSVHEDNLLWKQLNK